MKDSHAQSSGTGRVDPEKLIRMALDQAATNGREASGFWLGQQLRDNGYTEGEAHSAMRNHRSRTGDTNTKGHREAYAEAEMEGSLKRAYERGEREPWERRSTSATYTRPELGAEAPDPPREPPPAGNGPPVGNGGLPSIYVHNRQMRDYSDESLQALQIGNTPPTLFVRSEKLVAVITNEKQRQVISEVGESALRGRMSRAANYLKKTAKRDVEVSPPLEAVRDILAAEPSRWSFPPLDGVVEAPVLRADGSILDLPGYDPATSLYYSPDPDLKIPLLAEQPTQDHIDAALFLIDQAIGEFPLKDAASKANAIAAMLTPIVKPAIDAPAPLGALDASQAGTGKSLLADVISIIATGRAGEIFSAPKEDDEWRKQLTTALKSGTNVVIIYNVSRKLESPELAKVLTETTHADREFNTQNKILLPVKSTFFATGNNLQLGGDMPRRCYWVRMEAETSTPFLRSGFKIENLKMWTAAHRGELLAALLTLCRAWYVAGRKKPRLTPLGSFELWSIAIGGILQHAGVEGFLGNSKELYEESDFRGVAVGRLCSLCTRPMATNPLLPPRF